MDNTLHYDENAGNDGADDSVNEASDEEDDENDSEPVEDTKKVDAFGNVIQKKVLTEVELKRKLRQLGLLLKQKVKEFMNKYDQRNIAFDAIERSSKKINICEAKLGKYLSLVMKNEQIYQHYMKTHLIKINNQQKLDKTVAIWLQKFNPHIAELTSYARAKWVAGSLVRVYENEWKTLYSATRAKHTARITDRDILETIRDTVRFCYDRCRDLAWKMSVNILRQLYFTSNYTMDNCPVSVRLHIRELVKRSTPHTLPFVQKVVRQDIVHEPRLRTLLMVHKTQKPPLRPFLDLCSEIIWYMLSQDPPMVMEFTNDSEPLNFKPYNMIGAEIDFIVWPTVLLHEEGMVLANGVAEFFHLSPPSSPLIVKENNKTEW